MEKLFQLLHLKNCTLFFYSPFSFLGKVNRELLTKNTVINPLIKKIKNKKLKVINIQENNEDHYFLEEYLEWDSIFFQMPTFKIELIICNHSNLSLFNKAIKKFLDQTDKGSYYFIDIPAEDTFLIQALSQTNFRLIETRLNYFLSIENHKSKRYPVRIAERSEATALGKVASNMRNKYDRIHADPVFSNEKADKYLDKFARESVKGFADYVLVPKIENQDIFGFLAANKPIKIEGYNISKYVLAAVDSSIQKGWLSKLVSEMNHMLKDNNTQIVTTITQAPNGSAINVWEKSGFKLSHTSHIFSFKND